MYKKGRVNSNSRIISTDEDPSLRIESSAIINLRGVSTKLNKYIVFTMQTYKKLMMTLLNRLHSNARAKHPYNLLILNSMVKILSNYFVRRYCIIDKNVSGVCPNGKGPPS